MAMSTDPTAPRGGGFDDGRGDGSGDETVVVPGAAGDADPESTVIADATVAVARGGVPEDATVVVPQLIDVVGEPVAGEPATGGDRSAGGDPGPGAPGTGVGDSSAPGAPEPERPAEPWAGIVVDRRRRAAVPEPRGAQKAPASLGQLPRVYGPRPVVEALPGGADEVLRRIGPPPEGVQAPATPRPALPSLRRRERRARIATLAGYAVAVAVAVTGLIVIARVAFG